RVPGRLRARLGAPLPRAAVYRGGGKDAGVAEGVLPDRGPPGPLMRSSDRDNERTWRSAVRQDSIRLQQAIDVVELVLGPALFAGAAAQFVEDLAAALALELERHLVDARVDRVAVVAVRAAERIAFFAAALALLDLGQILAVARSAIAHLLGEIAHALLQVVQSPALRARGIARIAAAQRVLGLPHRALGAAPRLGHRHAVLVQPVHEFAELPAQAFLLATLLLSPLAVARLLALLALLPLLAALALATLLLTAFALGLAQKLVLAA